MTTAPTSTSGLSGARFPATRYGKSIRRTFPPAALTARSMATRAPWSLVALAPGASNNPNVPFPVCGPLPGLVPRSAPGWGRGPELGPFPDQTHHLRRRPHQHQGPSWLVWPAGASAPREGSRSDHFVEHLGQQRGLPRNLLVARAVLKGGDQGMALAAHPPPVGIVDAYGRGQLDNAQRLQQGAPAFLVTGVVRQAVDGAE